MTFRTSDPLATDDETTRVTIGAQQLARLRRIEQAATRYVDTHRAFWAAEPGAPPRSAVIAAEDALAAAVRS